MTRIAYKEFLGNSPDWFKMSILVFLVLCIPLKMVVGTTVLGWMFLAMFYSYAGHGFKMLPTAKWRASGASDPGTGFNNARDSLARDTGKSWGTCPVDIYGEFHLLHEAITNLCICKTNHERAKQMDALIDVFNDGGFSFCIP